MLCGCLPYDDPNTQVLYKKILRGNLQCPSYLSKEAKDLIYNILVNDPRLRITLDEIKTHPWCLRHPKTTYRPQTGLNFEVVR
jgi:5'-AMP-activated protein kinase catalytic alpha subunit